MVVVVVVVVVGCCSTCGKTEKEADPVPVDERGKSRSRRLSCSSDISHQIRREKKTTSQREKIWSTTTLTNQSSLPAPPRPAPPTNPQKRKEIKQADTWREDAAGEAAARAEVAELRQRLEVASKVHFLGVLLFGSFLF